MDQETKGTRDGHHRGYGGPWVQSAAFRLCQHGLPVSSEAPSSRQPTLIHTQVGRGPISWALMASLLSRLFGHQQWPAQGW